MFDEFELQFSVDNRRFIEFFLSQTFKYSCRAYEKNSLSRLIVTKSRID